MAHNIGAFLGEIVKAVKADVTKVEVSRETSEETVQGPQGQELLLRRTTIEEVVVEKPKRE